MGGVLWPWEVVHEAVMCVVLCGRYRFMCEVFCGRWECVRVSE